MALRTNGRKLSSRKDYLNFLKRVNMEKGKPFFYQRYVSLPKLKTQELKFMCTDVIRNDTTIAQKIFDSPEFLDSRALNNNPNGKKTRYISTSSASKTHYLNSKKIIKDDI